MSRIFWTKFLLLFSLVSFCLISCKEDVITDNQTENEDDYFVMIESSLANNGLSFAAEGGSQEITFSTGASWTLSIASTTSGTSWCSASATTGSKGVSSVIFNVGENTGYDDRSVAITIASGSASQTFIITQKNAEALLITTNKYEVGVSGGTVNVQVQANIGYSYETSASWISEVTTKSLTSYSHSFTISASEEYSKREGYIYFKSGDKSETVTIYQSGEGVLVLSQNEYTVSSAGETITIDIKSNFDYSVDMPAVDWISTEAFTKGMSSHS